MDPADSARCPNCGGPIDANGACDACAMSASGDAPEGLPAIGDTLRVMPAALDARVLVSAVPIELRVVGIDPVYEEARAVDTRDRHWRLVPALPSAPGLRAALPLLLDVPVATVEHRDQSLWLLRDPPGIDLADRLQQRSAPPPIDELPEWVEPIAEALQKVHAAGYVCLRLSPWHIRYLDDGSAWFVRAPGAWSRALPMHEPPRVTGFTAPELYADAVGRPPDPAADVFAFGAICWCIATGATVPVSQAAGFIPALRIRELAPEIPVPLTAFFRRVLAPDPHERPATVAAALAELRDALRAEADVRTAANDGRTLRVAAASETHPGIAKRVHRPTNQDAVVHLVSGRRDRALIAVADGVSTAAYGSGDIASGLVRSRLLALGRDWVHHPDPFDLDDVRQALVGAVEDANRDLVERVNARYGPFRGEPADVMGTTCAAIAIAHNHAIVVSSGDSRAYLLRAGRLERLTREHSVGMTAVLAGANPDAAFSLAHASALERCIGVFTLQDDGTLLADRVEPDVVLLPLAAGDRLLTCTDGLPDFVGDTDDEFEEFLARILGDADLPDLACIELIAAANRGGGGDNIGVACAFVDPEPPDVMAWFQRAVS